jgi:hypothetical protein
MRSQSRHLHALTFTLASHSRAFMSAPASREQSTQDTQHTPIRRARQPAWYARHPGRQAGSGAPCTPQPPAMPLSLPLPSPRVTAAPMRREGSRWCTGARQSCSCPPAGGVFQSIRETSGAEINLAAVGVLGFRARMQAEGWHVEQRLATHACRATTRGGM